LSANFSLKYDNFSSKKESAVVDAKCGVCPAEQHNTEKIRAIANTLINFIY
jgi:hypothetical protein